MINYYGVFEDGRVLYKSNVDDLLTINGIKFLFKKELVSQRTTEYGKTYYSNKYTLITREGLPTTYKLGAFELLDIGPEWTGYNDKCDIRYQLKNLNTGSVHEFDISEAYNLSFIYEKIIPMMEKLNTYGSYLAYQNALKLADLQKENLGLKEEIKQLRTALNKVVEIASLK